MEVVVAQHLQATGFLFQQKLQEPPLTVYKTVDGASSRAENNGFTPFTPLLLN
jgi:hypothetical protein